MPRRPPPPQDGTHGPARGAGYGGPSQGAGTGGPSTGHGWGGPAQGAHPLPAEPFTAQSPQRATVRSLPERQARLEARASWLAELDQRLMDIVRDDTTPASSRVTAIFGMLDRIEGPPVTRSVNVNVDDISKLSDDELQAELRSELARSLGEATTTGSGSAAPDGEGEL